MIRSENYDNVLGCTVCLKFRVSICLRCPSVFWYSWVPCLYHMCLQSFHNFWETWLHNPTCTWVADFFVDIGIICDAYYFPRVGWHALDNGRQLTHHIIDFLTARVENARHIHEIGRTSINYRKYPGVKNLSMQYGCPVCLKTRISLVYVVIRFV